MAYEWVSLGRIFQALLELEQDAALVERLLLPHLWSGAIRAISRRAFVEEQLASDIPIPDKASWLGWPDDNPVTFDWLNSRAVSPRGYRRPTRNAEAQYYPRTEYYRVEVRVDDFLALWPEARMSENSAPGSDTSRSGAPGRPTSKHLVECELDRREAKGERRGTIDEWSKTLSDWLRTTHPTMPPMQPATIRNQLRSRLRGLIETKHKP